MQIKENSWVESEDGREDVSLEENGNLLITITQEMYRPYGISYSDIKTNKGMGEFLMIVGLLMTKGDFR